MPRRHSHQPATACLPSGGEWLKPPGTSQLKRATRGIDSSRKPVLKQGASKAKLAEDGSISCRGRSDTTYGVPGSFDRAEAGTRRPRARSPLAAFDEPLHREANPDGALAEGLKKQGWAQAGAELAWGNRLSSSESPARRS